MPLRNFFDINLPYGIRRNDNDEWTAHNREYLPLGYNEPKTNNHTNDHYTFTKYKGITEARLLKLGKGGKIERDEAGKIKQVWLYDGSTNPSYDVKNWPTYLSKLKLLSKFQTDDD